MAYEHWWWQIIADKITRKYIREGKLPFIDKDGYIFRDVACNTVTGYYSCGRTSPDINKWDYRVKSIQYDKKEIIQEIWPELDEYEKISFMSIILGSKNDK